MHHLKLVIRGIGTIIGLNNNNTSKWHGMEKIYKLTFKSSIFFKYYELENQLWPRFQGSESCDRQK